jgi:hypothetical protein
LQVLVIDLLCIVGFMCAERIAQHPMRDLCKRKGWWKNYRLFMASWGTGKVEGITFNYRLLFGAAAGAARAGARSFNP